MTVRFIVYGLPQPAGSKRAFPFKRKDGKIGVAVSDANPKAKSWKGQVAMAARQATKALAEGPLVVSMTFYIPRPKGHYGTKGVRPGAPMRPTVRPDVLKLARAVEDAMSGIVYRDDSQIVKEVLVKQYTEEAARTFIEVRSPAGAE